MQSMTFIRSTLSIAISTVFMAGVVTAAETKPYQYRLDNSWLHIAQAKNPVAGAQFDLARIFKELGTRNVAKVQHIELSNAPQFRHTVENNKTFIGQKAVLNINDMNLKGQLVTTAGILNKGTEADQRTYQFNINNSTIKHLDDQKNAIVLSAGWTNENDISVVDNTHVIQLSNSNLDGNVAWQSGFAGAHTTQAQGFVNIDLTNKSNWTGDLSFSQEALHHANVSLDRSSWHGGVQKADTTNVQLKNGSTWQAMGGKVNIVSLENSTLVIASDSFASNLVQADKDSRIVLDKDVQNATMTNLLSTSAQPVAVELNNPNQTLSLTKPVAEKSLRLIVGSDYAENGFVPTKESIATLFNQVHVGRTQEGLKAGYFRIENNNLVADVVGGYFDQTNNSFNVTTTVNENVLLPRTVDMLAATQWRQEATFLTDRLSGLRAGTLTNGAWARVAGSKLELDTLNADYDYAGIEVGYDRTMALGTGALTAGVAATYTDGESDFTNGSADHTTGSVSLYGSYRFEKGSFVDLTAKFGRLENEMHLTSLNANGKDKAWATALSANFGHTFSMNSFYVEPVINVSYTSIQDKEYQIGAIHVNRDKVDSFMMGAGVTAGTSIDAFDLSARAMVRRDFTGELAATYADAKGIKRDVVDMADTWGELGLRATYNVNQNVTVSADVETAFGGDVDMPVRGSVTARYNF